MTHDTREIEATQLAKALAEAYDEGVEEGKQYLHQQLQKARHDWLREEIVSLEESKPTPPNILVPDESPIAHALREGEYQALQTIIDRYQKKIEK